MDPKSTNAAEALEKKDGENLDSIVENLDEGEAKKDDIKEEESENKSPYEQELERLKADNAKQAELIANKNRAINALKKKSELTPAPAPTPKEEDENVIINGVTYRKADVEAIKSLVKEETDQLRQALTEKDKDLLINSSIADLKERELVKWHLENTLHGGSGDINEDIKNARLLANRNILMDTDESKEAMREEVLASFSAGVSSNSRSAGQPSMDEATKQAIDLLRSAGQNAAADRLLNKK